MGGRQSTCVPLFTHGHHSSPTVTPRHPSPIRHPAGDLRAVLYGEVDGFVDALGGRDYLGGSAPNLADLAAFGVLRAVAGTPTYNDVVLNTKVCVGGGGAGLGLLRRGCCVLAAGGDRVKQLCNLP